MHFYAVTIQNPHLWSVLAVANLLLFAFKSEKYASQLGFTVTDTTETQNNQQFSPRNLVKLAIVLTATLAAVSLLKNSHFYFTLAALMAFFIHFWVLTYKNRIKRLKDAGLPFLQVVFLCSIFTLFSLFALIAISVFSWATRGAP